MSTTTIETRPELRGAIGQVLKNSKMITILIALLIGGVGVFSFVNSRQQSTSLQAMSDYYASHKILADLTEKNKWEFQKLNVDEAIVSVLPGFKKVMENHPSSRAAFLARAELAQFYVNHGEAEKAIALYEGNLKHSSGLDSMTSHFALALTFELLGKCTEARSHFEKSFSSTESTFKMLAQEGLTRCVK
ncbi:MAG: hypothetical protein KA715_08280 [Xanthomonadaceae bacterium]|nr:hypothetical protein [Xanthomonadaceae bacterium]